MIYIPTYERFANRDCEFELLPTSIPVKALHKYIISLKNKNSITSKATQLKLLRR